MKILLIGHSIIDRFEGSENDLPKPGGLFYSSLGIFSLAQPNDKIYLLTSWNDESIPLFENVYSKMDFSFANKIEMMPEVILKTSHAGEREEVYKNLSVQLSLDKVSDWNSFDGILVNMVTGFDLSLEQLRFVRKNFTGPIYIDIHTLSRGVGKDMKREFRPVPNAKDWISNVNVIQVNESELRTLSDAKSEIDCVKEILDWGTEMIIVTKGEHGASLYFNSNKSIKVKNVDGLKINAVNKIGCGDIFGAVFFYSYISTKDVGYSLEKANRAGAFAASISNLINYSKLKLNDV
jgi:hypothetical protein